MNDRDLAMLSKLDIDPADFEPADKLSEIEQKVLENAIDCEMLFAMLGEA